MNRRPVALAAFTSLLLSGCALGTVGTADRVSRGSIQDASRYMNEARQPLPPADLSQVQSTNEAYTSGVAHRSDHGEPLPRQWERDNAFTLKSAVLLPLYEIGTLVTDTTRIPVVFSPEITEAGVQSQAAAPVTAASPIPAAAGRPGGDISSMLASMGLSGAGGGNTAGAQGGNIRALVGSPQAMKIGKFDGSLSRFLNQVSAHFGVSWEYSSGEIRIFRNVTRTYTVHALPSSIGLQSTLSARNESSGSGSTTSGANNGSNQAVKSSVTIEIWKDVTAAVESIVGGAGRVTTSVSTGTITVTAPPSVVTRVQTYLDGQNQRLSKQVAVSVQVLNVTVSNSDNYALDFQGLFSRAAQYGITLASPTTAIPAAAGSLGFTILNNNRVAGGNLNGSSAVLQALSTAGRVTVKTTASLMTLNGIPAPLQIANTRGYVKDVSVSDGTTALGSGAATTRTQINTDTVTTGFSLSLLPRIDPDGRGLLMQFGINISELNGADSGFDKFSSADGKETVQLQNVNSRNFVQQAYVPNGSTLVLAGYEQTNDSGSSSGVGNAGFLGLGGGQVGSATRQVVVILMTPVVVKNEAPQISSE